MEALRIIPDLTRQGFKDGEYEVQEYKGPIIVGGMPDGTESGKPVVMIAWEEDGVVHVAQTTLMLFLSAAAALKARYEDL